VKVMHFDFVVEDPHNGPPDLLEDLVVDLFKSYGCRVTRSSSCTTANLPGDQVFDWAWTEDE